VYNTWHDCRIVMLLQFSLATVPILPIGASINSVKIQEYKTALIYEWFSLFFLRNRELLLINHEVLPCSLELLQQYFSTNKQYFSLTINQYKPNFSDYQILNQHKKGDILMRCMARQFANLYKWSVITLWEPCCLWILLLNNAFTPLYSAFSWTEWTKQIKPNQTIPHVVCCIPNPIAPQYFEWTLRQPARCIKI
jgi:hypothetical protein